MVGLIVLMGIIIKKLVANVFHNGWWKCGHMAQLHVYTLNHNYNIVVALVAYLQ
jgi:hypothetical protein